MHALVLLLHGSADSASHLRSALALRNGLDAELVVLHPEAGADAPIMAGVIGGFVPPVEVDVANQTATAARAAFDSVCAGDPRCSFKETRTSSYETLRKHAMFADFCVIAREPGMMGEDLGMLKAALLTHQLPTILLPAAPVGASPSTVVCSWNGQPQSARAIKAALPFLLAAKRVLVLEHAANEVNRSRLSHFFERSGVANPEWRQYGDSGLTARGRARALLAAAAAENAELLVTGAYGEIGEKVLSFGRATDKIAAAAKVPVLFAS